MKKLLSVLVSAAVMAMPLATLPTKASAAPQVQTQAEKKDMPKAKTKAKKAGGKKKAGKKKAA